MIARRMLMFVAVLFAVTAIAAAFAPPPPRDALDPTEPVPATTGRPRDTVTRRIDAGAATPATIRLRQGDRLHLEVRGTMLDAVELQGLGGIRPLGPSAVAVFDVLTDASGRYPVVLTGANKRIATIDVTPPPREGLAPVAPLIHRTRDS